MLYAENRNFFFAGIQSQLHLVGFPGCHTNMLELEL